MYSVELSIDDIHNCKMLNLSRWKRQGTLTFWLQAGTTNQESVDIRLLGKFLAVLCIHAATIQDTGLVCSFSRDGLLDPLANGGMNLLCLLGGSNLACTNGPEGRLASYFDT
jgi:hypothetical protein